MRPKVRLEILHGGIISQGLKNYLRSALFDADSQIRGTAVDKLSNLLSPVTTLLDGFVDKYDRCNINVMHDGKRVTIPLFPVPEVYGQEAIGKIYVFHMVNPVPKVHDQETVSNIYPFHMVEL
jgi:hypothetical protein